MPTHQGKTQTDITTGGGGGASITETSAFEYSATYTGAASLHFADYGAGTDRQYSAYELIVRDSTGSTLASVAARYKAWVDRGSATGDKAITIDNTFNPNPDGNSPAFPTSPTTSAERAWKVDTFDATGNLFATAQANWQVRTTVASGGRVIQTVVDQTDDLLRLSLVYLSGDTVLLDAVVSLTGSVRVNGRVTADPPDVTDRFYP